MLRFLTEDDDLNAKIIKMAESIEFLDTTLYNNNLAVIEFSCIYNDEKIYSKFEVLRKSNKEIWQISYNWLYKIYELINI